MHLEERRPGARSRARPHGDLGSVRGGQGLFHPREPEGVWQETAIQYKAQAGEAYVILNYKRLPGGVGPHDDGSMWVDDVWFGAGTSFRQPSPTPQAFAGSMVQVDGQGNFQILRHGTWQPFFAFAVYRGGTSNTVQDYSWPYRRRRSIRRSTAWK